MDATSITAIVSQVGPTGAMLVLLWRICVWLAPKLESVVQAHISFLDSTAKVQQQQLNLTAKMSGQIDELHDRVVVNRCQAPQPQLQIAKVDAQS
jgi:hypothetical protein